MQVKHLCDTCQKHNISCPIEPDKPVIKCVEYKMTDEENERRWSELG